MPREKQTMPSLIFTRLRSWLVANRITIIVVLGLLLVTVAMWLPFEMNRIAVRDPWSRLFNIDRDLNNGELGPLLFDGDRARSFTHLIWIVAYALSPYAFWGANVLQLILVFLTGVGVYGVMHRAFPQLPHWMVFFVAVMTIVYPGDTHQFYMGANAGRFGIVLYLLAFYMLLMHYKHPRWYKLVVMAVALSITMGINERVYPLVYASPLALLWLEGRVTRKIVIAGGIWYGIALIWSVRFVLLFMAGNVEQRVQSLITGEGYGLVEPFELVARLANAVRYLFSEAWISELSVQPGMIVSTIFSGLLVLWIFRRLNDTESSNQAKQRSEPPIIVWLMVGVGILILGYLPFAIVDFDLYSHTLYLSVIGAGLVIAVLLYWVNRFVWMPSWGVVLVASIVVGVASLVSMDMHQQYVNDGRKLGNVFGQMIQSMGRPRAQNGIVFFVRTDLETFTNATSIITEGRLTNGLRLVTGVRYPFCVYPEGIVKLSCAFDNESVKVFHPRHQVLPWSQVIAFEYQENGDISMLSSIPESYLPEGVVATDYNPQPLIRFFPEGRRYREIYALLQDYPKPIIE